MQLFDNFSAPLHSLFDDTEGTKRIAQIVAETNAEFNNRISEIENNVKHDSVEYHGDNGSNHIFVTNWTQVVAVLRHEEIQSRRLTL